MATAATIQLVKRQPPFSGLWSSFASFNRYKKLCHWQNKHLDASYCGRSRRAPSSSLPTPSSVSSRSSKVQASFCIWRFYYVSALTSTIQDSESFV